MSSLTVVLPESLREFVDREATERGLGSPGDYLVALADEARKRASRAHLEALVAEGIESGPMVEMTADDWADIRREVRGRLEHERLGS